MEQNKMSMRLKSLLLEIGEGEVYSYKKTEERFRDNKFWVTYEFDTPEDHYFVSFEGRDREVYVTFSSSEYGIDKMTGEGRQFRVLSTVFDIARDFYDEYGSRIDRALFSGTPVIEKGEKTGEKRAKVYKYFAEKFFPDAEVIRNEGGLQIDFENLSNE